MKEDVVSRMCTPYSPGGPQQKRRREWNFRIESELKVPLNVGSQGLKIIM